MHFAQAAVIPTIGASPMLDDLVTSLQRAGVEQVWLYDNFPVGRDRDGADTERLHQVAQRPRVSYHQVEQSIYASWNQAMNEATDRFISVLHVLNDDVLLQPLAIAQVAGALYASHYAIMGYDHQHRDPAPPRRVTGSYRKHGVPGFAFAVKPDLCARVHDGYRWWGGDDDLFNRTEAMGHELAVLPGAWVQHPQPSLSSHRYPLLEPWHDQDRELLREQWGDTW